MWTMERFNQLSLKTENTFEAAQEKVKKPNREFAFLLFLDGETYCYGNRPPLHSGDAQFISLQL